MSNSDSDIMEQMQNQKDILSQLSLTSPDKSGSGDKGGSNPIYYSYIGTSPLLVRGNTRGIISSYFLGLSHSLLKWGIEGDFLTFCNSQVTLSTQELEELDTITTDDVTNAAKVILFNDEVHSFDEVIEQLIKAIKCSVRRAEKLTWEVHNKGKACVYDGDLPECLRVSSVLEEIALHTQVEY